MSDVQQVIHADAVLTPDGEIWDAEIVVDRGGTIVSVGEASGDRDSTHDWRGSVVMPGLVNAHTHSAMTLQRGVSDDDDFTTWLSKVQALEQHLTHDDLVAGLELAMVEMIETGTTAFADMYYWDRELLDRVVAAGMRVLAAPATFTAESVGFPSVSSLTGAEVTALTEELAAEYAGHAGVRIAFGPHAPYTCPPEFLRDVTARAKRIGVPIHTHISESAGEVAAMRESRGTTPAAYLEELGVFEARVLAAHCVHLTDDEIDLFARVGASVSHNPVSNLKLGNGIAPLPKFIDAGVQLSLGTDSVASNNSLDLFEELKTAALLPRGVRQDSTAVTAAQVLEMATSSGARAIGFPECGHIEAGAQADLIALDASGTQATQLRPGGLASHLVFVARGSDVRSVMIGGREVYAEGQHLTLDASAVRARAREATERLRRAVRLAD